jgi:hypothetical protein
MEGDEPPEPPKKGGAKKGQFFGKKRYARHLKNGKEVSTRISLSGSFANGFNSFI